MSSTFFPWLNTEPIIDGVIQLGRGVEAAVWGQTHSVYRLTDSTNNSVMAQTPLFTNYPARIRRTRSKEVIEDAVFDLVVFIATCDNRELVLGDTFQETGYGAQSSNIYTFAQVRPTRETVWIRTELNCTLTRPMPTAGQAAQLPASGPAEVLGYGGYQKDTEQVLVLANGEFGFSGVAGLMPASVQVGVQQLNRVRDSNEPKQMPTRPYREHFLAYIPPTPGEELNEKDIINAGNGDRYVIMSLLQTADAGIAGWICICERKAV